MCPAAVRKAPATNTPAKPMTRTKPPTKEPQSLRPSLISILLVLSLFCGVAIFLPGSLFKEDWSAYTTFATLIIGCGGAFAIGGLPSGGAKDASTLTSLTSIGLGGMMLAYKEVVTGDKGDWIYFLQVIAIVATLTFLGLLIVECLRRSSQARSKDYTPLTRQAMMVVAGPVVSAVVLAIGIWIRSCAWFLAGWLVLSVVLVGILIASKKSPKVRPLSAIHGHTRSGRRRPLYRSVRRRRSYRRRLRAASRGES
jgi:cation transport ATPase